MRRTGRTPIEDNAAKRRNIVIEACVPLSREGTLGNILDTENRKYFLEYRVKNCNKNSDKYGLAAKIGSAKMIAQEKTDTDVEFKNYNNVRGKIVVNNLEFLSKGKHTIEVYLGQDDKEKKLISTYTFLVE